MQPYLGFIGLSIVFSAIIVLAFLIGIFMFPILSKQRVALLNPQKASKDAKKKSNIIPNQVKIGDFTKNLGEIYEEKMDEFKGFDGF